MSLKLPSDATLRAWARAFFREQREEAEAEAAAREAGTVPEAPKLSAAWPYDGWTPDDIRDWLRFRDAVDDRPWGQLPGDPRCRSFF